MSDSPAKHAHRSDGQAMETVHAWYAVILLCLLATLSYLDRYIIALLAEPIMQGMSVSETEIGFLIGLGFGLVYSIAAFPLAHVADRTVRVRLIGFGVLLWSAATIGSGLAPTYELLLVSRTGVALGEAVLVPSAISLIADYFPLQKRTLPVGCFMAVSALMGSGAFVLGGLVFEFAGGLSGLPISSWRLTMILVGLPGIVVALVWLATVREPARQKSDIDQDAEDATLGALFAFLRNHWKHYLPMLSAMGLQAVGIYSVIMWMSTVLVRSYDVTVEQAGYYYGSFGTLAAAVAVVAWPVCNSFFVRSGRPELSIVAMAVGLGTALLAMGGLMFTDSLPLALGIIFVATFGFAAGGTLAVLVFQAAAPARLRGKIMSLYMLVGNIVGLTLAPPLSAWVAGQMFPGDDGLRMTLSVFGLVLAPLVVVAILLSLPGYPLHSRKPLAPAGAPLV